jgi:hypothetical protein
VRKLSPLDVEEHEKAAEEIRRFAKAVSSLLPRFNKSSKVGYRARKILHDLMLLKSVLDDDYCSVHSRKELYHTSPYFGGGVRLTQTQTRNRLATQAPQKKKEPAKK